MRAIGTLTDDGTKKASVDLLAAYNAASDPKLGDDVGWTPSLRVGVDDTDNLGMTVGKRAGPGAL